MANQTTDASACKEVEKTIADFIAERFAFAALDMNGHILDTTIKQLITREYAV
jgi:hypothetical protein